MTRLALALLLVSSVAQAASDHHCKLPDGSFDGTKSAKQCSDAKGTWTKDASYTGTLRTGINAIGGETTGVEIQVGGQSYEVDVHGDKTLQASVDKLDGKHVTVTGYLTTKKGGEVSERHIIVVSTLAAAK